MIQLLQLRDNSLKDLGQVGPAGQYDVVREKHGEWRQLILPDPAEEGLG